MTSGARELFPAVATGLPSMFAASFEVSSRALVRRFGGTVSSLYLECRLGPRSSAQTDVLLAVSSCEAEEFERTVAGRGAGMLNRFCRRWNERGSALHREISAVWLEYDDIEPCCAWQQPCLSACLVRGYGSNGTISTKLDRHATFSLMTEVVEVLRGAPASVLERAKLQRCATALPDAGRIIHLSSMAAREHPVLKLYLAIPRHALCDYLDLVGWRGPMTAIAALVDDLYPTQRVGNELYVDLTLDDLDAVGGNRIGLVFTPQHLEHSQERDPGRRPLLDALVERELCSRKQAAELAAWPERTRHGNWGDGRRPITIERWLDLKVVWQPSSPLAAKAYLGHSARPALPSD
jgi:hypothetical protein